MRKLVLLCFVSVCLPCFAAHSFCDEFLSVASAGGAGQDNIGNAFDNFVADGPSLVEARAMARAFVAYEGAESIGLYVEGAAGVGKTHLALAAARELIVGKKARVLYVGPTNFMAERDKSDRAGEKYFAKFDAVILDGVTVEGIAAIYVGNFLMNALTVYHRLGGRKILVAQPIPQDGFLAKLYYGPNQGASRTIAGDLMRTMFQTSVVLPGQSRRRTAGWYRPSAFRTKTTD